MQTGTKLAPSAVRPYIEFVVYSAASLARQAEYQSAQELLLTVPDEVATAQVFDLRARIYVQQHKYGDAETQWRRAVERDPANGEYQECLRQAARRRLNPALSRPRSITAVILVLAALTGSLAVWQHRRTRTKLDTVSSQPATIAQQKQAAASPTEFRFSGPLFSSGTRFSRAGTKQIRQIGDQLHAASRIEILGQTDSKQLKAGSKYRDNQELGLARASAVALVLHKDLGIPLTKMTVASGNLPDERGRVASSHDLRTAVIRIWDGGQ